VSPDDPRVTLTHAHASADPRRLALLSLAHFSIDGYSSFVPPLLPLLIANLHLSLTMVGILLVASSVSSSFSQPLFGRIADRLRRPAKASATEVGWWAHARRKFHALVDSDARVAYPLKLISQLYQVEDLADHRGLDAEAEARERLRQERASPILERLDRWVQRTVMSEPQASSLVRACA
jgi:hypothetical protein